MTSVPFGTSILRLAQLFDEYPTSVGLALAGALVAICATSVAVWRAIRALARRGWTGEQALTVLAAAIATGVSAQGMWVFMGDALHLTYLPRLAFFTFLEVMVVQSALRARVAQRTGGSPGVDGLAMWALTCLSALLSATGADNLGMLLLRVSAPIVAAWGWERSMALERRQRMGTQSRINWRITPERLLIRLGLADPNPDRTASDDAAQRNLVAVALAVDDARAIRDSGNASVRQTRRAHQRLRDAMRRATGGGGLVPFDGRDHRDVLVDYIAVLRGTAALLDLKVSDPFSTAVMRSGAQREDPGNHVEHHHDDEPSGDAQEDVALSPPALPADRRDDLWREVAERVCAYHPARRRHRAEVETILRLYHAEHRTYPEIAHEVSGFSKHAVGRVLRHARPYHSVQATRKLRGGERDAA